MPLPRWHSGTAGLCASGFFPIQAGSEAASRTHASGSSPARFRAGLAEGCQSLASAGSPKASENPGLMVFWESERGGSRAKTLCPRFPGTAFFCVSSYPGRRRKREGQSIANDRAVEMRRQVFRLSASHHRVKIANDRAVEMRRQGRARIGGDLSRAMHWREGRRHQKHAQPCMAPACGQRRGTARAKGSLCSAGIPDPSRNHKP